jgi:hypothetical protein
MNVCSSWFLDEYAADRRRQLRSPASWTASRPWGFPLVSVATEWFFAAGRCFKLIVRTYRNRIIADRALISYALAAIFLKRFVRSLPRRVKPQAPSHRPSGSAAAYRGGGAPHTQKRPQRACPYLSLILLSSPGTEHVARFRLLHRREMDMKSKLVTRDQFNISPQGIVHKPTDAAFAPRPGDPYRVHAPWCARPPTIRWERLRRR